MFEFLKKKPKRISLTSEEIFNIVQLQLGKYIASNCKIRFSDSTHSTVTEQEAFSCVLKSYAIYLPEVNDCDDAALIAKANAIELQRKGTFNNQPGIFGIMWIPSHAFNWYISADRQIHLIDNDGSILYPKELKEQINLILV